MSDAMIRQWLDRASDYPKPNGKQGWVAERDELMALLSECTPRVPLSVIPERVTDSTVTFFIRMSVTFDRAELTDGTDA